MKKVLLVLAILALAVSANAASTAVDYSGPYFANGQLWSSWGGNWEAVGYSGGSVVGTNQTGFDVYAKQTDQYGYKAWNGEIAAFKWFQVGAGTTFNVSSNYSLSYSQDSTAVRMWVYTTNNTNTSGFNWWNQGGIAAQGNGDNSSQAVVTNSGSFTTANMVSQGYVMIGIGAWSATSFGGAGGEYKGLLQGSLSNTFINTQDVVPEPSSFLALGSGLMGLAGFVIRRRK